MKRSIVVSALFVGIGASIAFGLSSPEPTGVEKLKFGASVDEAKKAYPAMEHTQRQLAAPAFNHAKLTRYLLAQQKVEGFEKPIDLELRFWDGKFWIVVFYFGDNDTAKVLEMFRQRFGKPDYEKDDHIVWAGTKVAATGSIKNAWLELHDEGISNAARQELFKGLLHTGDAMTPAASGTPPATAPASAGAAAGAVPPATPVAK